MEPSDAGTLFFVCPHCECAIQAPSFSLGARGLCPHCDGPVIARDDVTASAENLYPNRAAFRDPGLTPSDKILLMCLAGKGWDGIPFAMTDERFEELLSIGHWTPRRIKKGIRRLERAGYIRCERGDVVPADHLRIQILKPVPRMKAS